MGNNANMNFSGQDEVVDAALGALVPRLRQFAVVAREEHLTRAAELLGVPQPTLSRSIARLEAELGVPLFMRNGRSIRLTRRGNSASSGSTCSFRRGTGSRGGGAAASAWRKPPARNSSA